MGNAVTAVAGDDIGRRGAQHVRQVDRAQVRRTARPGRHRRLPLRPVFALLGVVAVVSACLGPVDSLYPPRPGHPGVSVWVVDHGWHVGLVVERASLPDGLVREQRHFPDARFLEFGWGDAAFYRAPEGSMALALKAALASPQSALHVVGLDTRFQPPAASEGIVELRLSRVGFVQLVRFVDDTFERDGEAPAEPLGPGLYGASLFYPARGKYHLFNTCNTWVAEALRAAGCPVTPAYALSAGNVMWQARRAAQASAAR